MSTNFKVSLLLVLAWSKASCEKVKVTQLKLDTVPSNSLYSYRGGKISYGSSPDPEKELLKGVIESPNLICIDKGQSMELASEYAMTHNYEIAFKIAFDFSAFATVGSYDEDSKLNSNSKICLLFGYYTPRDYTNQFKVYIYLNFLSDKLSIEKQDLLFFYIVIDEVNFNGKLSKNVVSEYSKDDSNPDFLDKQLSWQYCEEKSDGEMLEFSLNNQLFSFDYVGTFNMAFVNNYDVKSKRTDDRKTDASYKCLKNSLIVTYSNQPPTAQKPIPQGVPLKQSNENILLII